MDRIPLRALGQAVCGCMVLLGAAVDVPAQGVVRRPGAPGVGVELPGGVPGRSPVQVRRITGTGRRDRMMTPQYSSSVSRGTKPAREWGMVTVEYATQPEWLDEVTVAFYVMSMVTKDGRNAYTFYRKEVTYLDVQQDRSHVADVYLLPSALERFGQVVAVAVEITVKGELVAQQSETALRDALPADWWKNEKVVKSEAVTIRDGYLLNRRESPFALINIDDYEAIK